MLEAVDVEVPKLARNESIAEAVERQRQRCRTLRADLHTIASAPYPSIYSKARARAQVEGLAQRGAVNVSRLVEVDGDIEFPALHVRTLVHNATPGAVVFHDAIDFAALVAWLCTDSLIKRLDAEIDAESDDASALSPEMRHQRAAEVAADLLETERIESELVWASEGKIEHRSDISPAALLRARLLTAPRPTALPTSPSMVIEALQPR